MSVYGDNTIKIHVSSGSPIIEAISATSALRPGSLIEYDSFGSFIVHPTQDGISSNMFVVEDSLSGTGIDGSYPLDDRAYAICARPGDVILVWVTSGQTISIGDFLTSSAVNGELKEKEVSPTVPNSIVGVALQAVTTTTEVARIKVQII